MRAGFGAIDVWPGRRYDLSGFVARDNPSTGVHDPVAVRALYVEAGEPAVIVSAGVLGFMPGHARDLRRRLARLLHVPERTVLLAATHTHSAPATMRLVGCGEVDPAWLCELDEGIIAAAVWAKESAEPARLSVGAAPVPGLVVNRRAPHGPRDETLTCLAFRTAHGRLLGIVAHFACHPVILTAANLEVSNDYPGAFLRHLAGRGVAALFLNGACGDINPAARGGFDQVQRMGELLAEAALALGEGADGVTEIVDGEVDTLRIAWAVPSPEELAEHQRHVAALGPGRVGPGSKPAERVAWVYADWVRRHATQPATWPPHLDVAVQVMRIGPVLLTALPGEIFCGTGLAIKEQLGPAALTVGYANGNIGYVPVREAYAEGGYEVAEAHRYYGYPGPVAAGTAEQMVERAVTLARLIGSRPLETVARRKDCHKETAHRGRSNRTRPGTGGPAEE